MFLGKRHERFNSLKVLFVYKDYFPVLGGIENHIKLLAEGLQEKGVEPVVLVTNTHRKTEKEIICNIPVIKTGRLVNISSAPISPGLYACLARISRGADVIHYHFPYPPAELWQVFTRSGKPVVLTYHCDIVRQKVLGFFYEPFIRRLLRRVNGIIVSSSNYMNTSRFLSPVKKKCSVIGLGTDLNRFKRDRAVQERAADIRKRYGANGLLLFVGRLRHYKGVHILIDAMKQVTGGHTLIVGSGKMERAWRRKAAKAGVSDRLTFMGEVSDKALNAIFHSADVFVFPSTNRAEAWGMAQVEAMACGLPVISTELGTGTSFVNQNEVTGFVVPPGDAAALASSIQRLIDDTALRKRMGEAACHRAHLLFSKEKMIERTLEVYRAVTSKQG